MNQTKAAEGEAWNRDGAGLFRARLAAGETGRVGAKDCAAGDGLQVGVMKTKNARLKSEDAAAVRREFAQLRKRLAEFDEAERESRRERGLKKLTEIVGVRGGKVLNELIEFSPELVRFIVDHAYGDVISRERLDGRARALVVIAALAAMGNAAPELKTHVGTALNSGCTREDILETMLLVGVYAGFPAAMNGMGIAREVMAARGVGRAGANAGGRKDSRSKRR